MDWPEAGRKKWVWNCKESCGMRYIRLVMCRVFICYITLTVRLIASATINPGNSQNENRASLRLVVFSTCICEVDLVNVFWRKNLSEKKLKGKIPHTCLSNNVHDKLQAIYLLSHTGNGDTYSFLQLATSFGLQF